MKQINTTPKNLQLNQEGKSYNEVDKGIVTEQDFAEFHALLESQYEQVLSDINEEIIKRTKRLVELRKSFGSSSHL